MASVEYAFSSSLVQRVTLALENLHEQGEFHQLQLGKKSRDGRVTHRFVWNDNRAYRFVIDMAANAVVIPAILPASLRSQLSREVLTFLRADGHLDADRGELRIFVRHGALTLSVTFSDDHYELSTAYLVAIAHRVIARFSEEQAQYECFQSRAVPGSIPVSEFV
jgi:hypothetical protein